MNKINIKVIMKNSKEYIINIDIPIGKNMTISDLINDYICKDMKTNSISWGCYELLNSNDDKFNGVAINSSEISSIEFIQNN